MSDVVHVYCSGSHHPFDGNANLFFVSFSVWCYCCCYFCRLYSCFSFSFCFVFVFNLLMLLADCMCAFGSMIWFGENWWWCRPCTEHRYLSLIVNVVRLFFPFRLLCIVFVSIVFFMAFVSQSFCNQHLLFVYSVYKYIYIYI